VFRIIPPFYQFRQRPAMDFTIVLGYTHYIPAFGGHPMKKIAFIVLISLITASLPLFAGGNREAESGDFVVPVPEGPEKPNIPSLLRNEDDFELVLLAYDELILFMEPLIESMIYNGIDANELPLERLREVIEWWKDYISSLKIEAESPSVRTSEIDEFLGGLIRKDQQFQVYLDELNRIIELENEANG
jgi:hypothetical protein